MLLLLLLLLLLFCSFSCMHPLSVIGRIEFPSYHKKKHRGAKEKAPKRKRTHSPSAYNLFVSKHYDSVRNIPSPQDRMRELGRRWKAQNKQVSS